MITFFSNFINDHQIPFCEAMYEKTEGNFRFVATAPISEDRLKLGFSDKSASLPYVVNAFTEDGKIAAEKLAEESDVVIWGDAPVSMVEKRILDNKLTFKYSERYFKKGKWRILDPRVLKARYLSDIRFKKKNLFMLCASAYTAPDCRFIGCYKGKAFKWGYFPFIKRYENIDGLIDGKKENSILWVARFLKLKRPEHVVYVADKLKKAGYSFSLDMIGIGEKQEQVKLIIKKHGLDGEVKLLGSMSPEQVRENMEKAEIFLFTSNKQEGWGAVLNESMNSGCAVVASKQIGSVPYLIKDGENGFSYKNKKDLYKKVKFLLDNQEKRKAMGKNAYQTLTLKWNAEEAAKRFIALIDEIKKGKGTPFTDGPCSTG